MTTVRVIPPAGGATTVVKGRTYTAAAGATLDVPDFDAYVLEANGWHILAGGGVGTTALRPTNPYKNLRYLDTTVGALIHWDGVTWRNTVTGASV
jgi:hypothetical protein